jgi:hypothetical protein
MQQEFPAGASWFSLSAANRSTTCDKMTKYVENGSGRRARASFLPPSSTKQLGKFMNHKNWGEKNPVAGLFIIILYKEQLFLATCVYCRAMCFSSDVIQTEPPPRSYFLIPCSIFHFTGGDAARLLVPPRVPRRRKNKKDGRK